MKLIFANQEIKFTSLLCSLRLTWLIFLGMALPSLGLYLIGASSMASGLLLALVIYIALLASKGNLFFCIRSSSKVVLTLALFVLVHGFVSSFLDEKFNWIRFFQSVVYLVIFLVGAFAFVLYANRKPINSNLSFKLLFYLYVIFAALSIYGISIFAGEDKTVLFYREPSHFALDFLPLLLTVVVVEGYKKKLFYLSIALLIGLLLQNLTLVFGVILITILMLSIRYMGVSILIFSAIFFASKNNFWIPASAVVKSSVMQRHYVKSDAEFNNGDSVGYLVRRLPTPNNKNISLLALYSGYERAYLDIVDTYGLGVGFQQFGIVGRMGVNMDEIIKILDFPLCLYDGSFVGAKFIGEFGLIAIAIILIYIFSLAKLSIYLRHCSLNYQNKVSPMDVFYSSCFITFFIDLFFRGIGYFSSPSFFFTCSVMALFLLKRHECASKFSFGRVFRV